MATTIQSLIQSAAPGSTVMVPTGTYNVAGLVLPGNITLKANGAVTLTGSMTVGGNNTTVSGFTFSGGTVNINGTVGTTIENNTFNGGSRSINLDAARDALITNNAFHSVSGNVLAGWGLDQSTISNNKFYDCWQPVNLNFNNNQAQGRYITVSDNYFTGTKRMPIEVGPSEAYTYNMVVEGNWSENMNNAGKDGAWSTDVAYSLVQGNGVNTVIKGNYAKGIGTGVGIELNGTGGEITGNYIDNFWYGSIVYGKGYNVHDNAFVGEYIERVLNYGNQSGTVQNNQTTAAGFSMPQKPGTAAPAPAPSEPVTSDPVPSDPTSPPTGDAGTGTNNPVVAGDDNYKVGVNQSHWFNTKYILMNDKGLDGGLSVSSMATKSAGGGTVTRSSDGTVKYTPLKDWQGKDSIDYTVTDKDGSKDTGTVYIQVGTGTTTPTPTPTEPAPTDPSSGGGTGNPVIAGDDNYKTGVDQKWYFNTKYLMMNDKGADGGLKVAAVASKSAAGATVTLDSSGTAIYTPLKGWQGKDSIEYTLMDRDGSTDTGIVHMQVGNGTTTPTTPTPTAPTTGTGNAVTVGDDYHKVAANEKYYFNSKYLLMNDIGKDGGLKVTDVEAATTKGGSVKWDAGTGTAIYTPKAGTVGRDSVEYAIADRDGSSDTGYVHFDVLLA